MKTNWFSLRAGLHLECSGWGCNGRARGSLPCRPLLLEVGPIKSSEGVWVSALSSLGGVWGGAPADKRFGAF